MDRLLQMRSARVFLCGQSKSQAEAKVHVIAPSSSPPEHFNEWWQSQTPVKMVTSLRVSGWPHVGQGPTQK